MGSAVPERGRPCPDSGQRLLPGALNMTRRLTLGRDTFRVMQALDQLADERAEQERRDNRFAESWRAFQERVAADCEHAARLAAARRSDAECRKFVDRDPGDETEALDALEDRLDELQRQ